MSTLDDIRSGISAVGQTIDETSTQVSGLINDTEEAIQTASALGPEESVDLFTAIKDALEGIGTQLAGVKAAVEEAEGKAGSS